MKGYPNGSIPSGGSWSRWRRSWETKRRPDARSGPWPRRPVNPPNKSGKKEASSGGSTRLLLAVLISAVFVSVLNSSMVNVVVPSIGEEFGASEGQVGWVITGYLLVYAIGIPLYGRISVYDPRSP